MRTAMTPRGAVAAAAAVLLVGCNDHEPGRTTTRDATAQTETADVRTRPDGTVEPGDAARPAAYYGRDVQVRAEVEDVFASGLFTFDEDAALAGPDVLGVTMSAISTTIP